MILAGSQSAPLQVSPPLSAVSAAALPPSPRAKSTISSSLWLSKPPNLRVLSQLVKPLKSSRDHLLTSLALLIISTRPKAKSTCLSASLAAKLPSSSTLPKLVRYNTRTYGKKNKNNYQSIPYGWCSQPRPSHWPRSWSTWCQHHGLC